MLGNERVALLLISWIAGLMACIQGLMSVPAGSTAMLANALIFLQLSLNASFAFRASFSNGVRQRRGIQLQGAAMILLGGLVFTAVMRWSMMGSVPHPDIIIGMGVLAFFASLGSWAIMLSRRSAPAGLADLWQAGRSDAVSNVAVIAAGGAVALTSSNIPDLVIGGGMAALFIVSGWRIAMTGRIEAGRPG
jgi:Co/Zn/Cd efflux system component